MTNEPATILVVDDLPQNVRLLEAILAPRGYRVVTATSGAEALERRRRRADRPRPARHPHARDGRLRGLPAPARRRRDALPAGRDDHGERRAGEGARRSRRAPTTSSPSRSTRRSCSRGSARCCGSSATTTRSRRRPPSSPRWNRELEQRVRRAGRGARAHGPAAALPLAAARRAGRLAPATSRSSRATAARSPSCSATCAASRRSPRRSSPRTSWRVLGEYHAALGDLVHRFEGTLERFTGDGLMVFFNDPLPCPDAPERAVRMAVAMRDARRPSSPRAGAGAATTSTSASASRRATRRSGASASRGAPTTPRSAA